MLYEFSHFKLTLKESCLKIICCLHLKRILTLFSPTDGMDRTLISTAVLSLPFNSEKVYLWGQNLSSQETKQEGTLAGGSLLQLCMFYAHRKAQQDEDAGISLYRSE